LVHRVSRKCDRFEEAPDQTAGASVAQDGSSQLEVTLPSVPHVRRCLRDGCWVKVEDAPGAPGVADWRAIVNLARVDGDHIAGSSLDLAAAAARKLPAALHHPDPEPVVRMPREGTPRVRQHGMRTG
jgi:hypothetical protein